MIMCINYLEILKTGLLSLLLSAMCLKHCAVPHNYRLPMDPNTV